MLEGQEVAEKVKEIVREDIFWNNSFSDWVEAAILFAIVFVPILLIKLAASKVCSKYFSEKDRIITYKLFILTNLSKLNVLLVAIVASYVGFLTLNTPDKFNLVYDYVLIGAIFLQILIWANSSINLHAEKYLTRNPNAITALSIFTLLAKVIASSLILLVMLDQMGINITALVAGLGIGGVAIAFALQNVLGDIFASLAIVLDKPFKVGDVIGLNQLVGTVQRVGLKTTRIRSVAGELLIVSNSTLLSSNIQNFGDMHERRTIEILGVDYNTPHAKLEKIPDLARAAVFSQKGTRVEDITLNQLAESSLNFEIIYHIQNTTEIKWKQVQHGVRMELIRLFEKEGISFAYPTRTVYTKTF